MDRDFLISRYWSYGLTDQSPTCNALRFGADGNIQGYYSHNEVTWTLDNQKDSLLIFDNNGNISVRFENISNIPTSDNIRVLGWYGNDNEPKIVMEAHPLSFQPKVFSQLRASMGHLVSDHGYEVGDYSYGFINTVDAEFGTMKIGRFCSIGPNFTAIIGNHDWRLTTTYPFLQIDRVFHNNEEQWNLSEVEGFEDHYSSGVTEIGNDVWVGKDVIVISGIKIGDGAVLAAGAVVTRDVPPYAIVGGNPAKIIRYRFNERDIERLLRISWWNWPREKIQKFLPLLLSRNIENFLYAAESEKKQV